MKVIVKTYRGKQLKVVYDAPCDHCSQRNKCKIERLVCRAFTQYVNCGWYDIYKVGLKLKKMK